MIKELMHNYEDNFQTYSLELFEFSCQLIVMMRESFHAYQLRQRIRIVVLLVYVVENTLKLNFQNEKSFIGKADAKIRCKDQQRKMCVGTIVHFSNIPSVIE